MNIKFCYRYRDAANYMQYNEIVFPNPIHKSFEDIGITIKKSLIDEEYFVANHWNVPDMHFKQFAWDPSIDQDWHEFDSVDETIEIAIEKILIEDFLNNIKEIAQ